MGVSKCFNYIALKTIKTVLKDAGLSDVFWLEALLCYVFAWNRTCHKGKKMPTELYYGRKPSISILKFSDLKCVWVYIPRQLLLNFNQVLKHE